MDTVMNEKTRINSFIDRAGNIEESIKDLQFDLAALYKEAKNEGYDAKTIKLVIKKLKKDVGELEQEDLWESTYREAAGIPVNK